MPIKSTGLIINGGNPPSLEQFAIIDLKKETEILDTQLKVFFPKYLH